MKRMIAFLFAVSMALGCLQTYQRHLETKYNKVHYDFFENRTLEPGLEIMLVDALMEETMKGRHLQVSRKDNADLIVRGTLNSLDQEVVGRDHQRAVTHVRITLKADVELYEPGKIIPFRTFENIEATGDYFPDVRRDLLVTKEEGKAIASQALARELVHQILYGEGQQSE